MLPGRNDNTREKELLGTDDHDNMSKPAAGMRQLEGVTARFGLAAPTVAAGGHGRPGPRRPPDASDRWPRLPQSRARHGPVTVSG